MSKVIMCHFAVCGLFAWMAALFLDDLTMKNKYGPPPLHGRPHLHRTVRMAVHCKLQLHRVTSLASYK